MNKIAIAIHGGAGTIRKDTMTYEVEQEYRSGLQTALLKGWQILKNGGSSLDAVEAAVVELENNSLFNAGRGAVFTHEGKNEMDACIMDGKTRRAGAAALVQNVKNPIKLARAIMENSEHILLAGTGAIEFAKQMNLEIAPDEYFFTDFRYRQLLKALDNDVIELDHAACKTELIKEPIEDKSEQKQKPIGTVGAAARDSFGNLAAATSTGGMTNKKFGRIGDTPITGAGTYADNTTCAVSCTGHGEYFMREVAAYDVACRMKYKNSNLIEAAEETIENLREIGGEGGLIAVDALGNIALPFNSEGMYRGFMVTDNEPEIYIF